MTSAGTQTAQATARTSSTSSTYSTTRLTPAQRRRRRALRSFRRLLRRLRRVLRRARHAVASVVTPLGWGVVALAVAALAVGYGAGWSELLVVGYALTLLSVLSAAHLLGRLRYDVSLSVDRARTVVGQPARASVALTAGRRPLWGGRVEVRLGDDILPLSLPSRSGGAADSAFDVPADRRGVVVVGPVRSVRGDPLGLFRRDIEWTATAEVRVYPALVTVPSTSAGFIRDLEGSPTRELTSSDISFHALREYRPGDDRRHIHWKSTARTGELTVRQFEETKRSHVAIAFGLARGDYASNEEFELIVSAASSIAVRAIRDGREVSVVTSPARAAAGDDPSRRPAFLPTVSRSRFLDAVAAIEPGSAEVGVGALAGLAAASIGGVSLVFLVVGTTPSLRELRSWSLRFPLGVEVVVIVCGPALTPSLRRVAELSVITIGYLDDLRRSLAGAGRGAGQGRGR